MAKIPDAYLHRIQRDLPGTDPNHLDYITDGMVNDVVVVDRTWVYRFAKHDWSQPLMQHEAKVLNLVRAHVDTPVPNLELLSDDCCRYPYLAGTPLTRRTLLGWTEADRNAVLKSVVRFVAQMHGIPIAEANAAGIGPSDTNRDASWWRTFHADLTTTLYPHLMRHQRDYVDDLFGPVLDGTLTFDHRPTLVYGDVASYHLLVDPTEHRLCRSSALRADGAASFTRSAGVGSCPTRPSSRIIVQSTRNRPSANSRGAIPWAALQRRCYRVDGPRADRRHHETSAPRR